MKVRVWNILSSDRCSIESATEHLMNLSENDAFALAYILRKFIWFASYDTDTLVLTIEEPLHIENISLEDITSLSKVMNKVPLDRTYKGVSKIDALICDLKHGATVTCQSHKKGEEESHES